MTQAAPGAGFAGAQSLGAGVAATSALPCLDRQGHFKSGPKYLFEPVLASPRQPSRGRAPPSPVPPRALGACLKLFVCFKQYPGYFLNQAAPPAIAPARSRSRASAGANQAKPGAPTGRALQIGTKVFFEEILLPSSRRASAPPPAFAPDAEGSVAEAVGLLQKIPEVLFEAGRAGRSGAGCAQPLGKDAGMAEVMPRPARPGTSNRGQSIFSSQYLPAPPALPGERLPPGPPRASYMCLKHFSASKTTRGIF